MKNGKETGTVHEKFIRREYCSFSRNQVIIYHMKSGPHLHAGFLVLGSVSHSLGLRENLTTRDQHNPRKTFQICMDIVYLPPRRADECRTFFCSS